MQSHRLGAVRPSDLTVEAAVPLALTGILIVASLFVAGRQLRRTGGKADLRELGPAAGLVLGSVGIATSVMIALDRPESILAFVLGAVGATSCYLGVFGRLFGDEDRTFPDELVAVTSVLWIAGALTVGVIAGADARHYAVGAAFGTLLAIATVGFTAWQRRSSDSPVGRSELLGGLLFAGGFLVPATVGTIFGEEILFVTYSIAFVLAVILWWFLRLSLG